LAESVEAEITETDLEIPVDPVLFRPVMSELEGGLIFKAITNEVLIRLKGCVWHTIWNGKTNRRFKLRYAGGINATDIEIEIDGEKQDDDLGSGQATWVEGKKIRVHAKGTEANKPNIGVTPCN